MNIFAVLGIFISSTDERLASLTDQDRSSHSVNEVSSVWEETYTERVKLLLQKEKRVKVVSLASYFSSFPCLRHPVGIVLVKKSIFFLYTYNPCLSTCIN